MNGFQLALVIATCVAIWVFIDSRKHRISILESILWMLGVFSIMLVNLPLYFIVRARSAKRPVMSASCEHCSKPYFGNPNYCPHCGHLVRKV